MPGHSNLFSWAQRDPRHAQSGSLGQGNYPGAYIYALESLMPRMLMVSRLLMAVALCGFH